MKLKNASIPTFTDELKHKEYEVVLFGAGVIAHIVMGDICKRLSPLNCVSAIVDNDSKKWETQIVLGDTPLTIHAPSYLKQVQWEGKAIVITASIYIDILAQLEELVPDETPCYILPIMCTSHLNMESGDVVRDYDEMRIPKKIHYMWFGSKELPASLQRCVDSWRTYCPDYEIIRWDEHNYDIEKNLYTSQAYHAKQWGFLSDYARLELLYEHGGIYLDTDVELIRSLDDMLFQDGFISIEKWMVINSGGGAGAKPRHPMIGKMLDFRRNTPFIKQDGTLNRTASGYYETLPFLEQGLRLDGTIQSVQGMNVYGFDYFHPYDYMTGETLTTKHTIGIHHFGGSWLESDVQAQRTKTKRKYLTILNDMES